MSGAAPSGRLSVTVSASARAGLRSDSISRTSAPIWLDSASVCMSQSSSVRPSPGRTSRTAMRRGSLVGISNVTSGFCDGGSSRTPPACQSRMVTVRAPGTRRRSASRSRERSPSVSVRVRLAASAAHKPAMLRRRSRRRRPADAAGWGAQLSAVMTRPAGRESRCGRRWQQTSSGMPRQAFLKIGAILRLGGRADRR